MSQFLRPSSDITNPSSWNGTFADIDETTASDTDFGYSDDKESLTYETALGSSADPISSIDHTVRCRVSRSDGGVPNNTSGSASSLQILLMQGTTQIAEVRANSSVGAWEDVSYELASGEVDNITDYTDLRLRFIVVGGGGSPSNRRGVAVSWNEMEVPNAAPTAYELITSKGSFILTSKNISTLFDRNIISSKDSFSLTGKNVDLNSGKNLQFIKGSFSFNGKNANLNYIRVFNLLSSRGVFNLTSKVIDLNYVRLFDLLSSKGLFNLIGKNSDLLTGTTLSLQKGAYSLSGKVIDLNYIKVLNLTSEKGVFNLTGKNVELLNIVQYNLLASKRGYNITDKDTELSHLRIFNLVSEKGIFNIIGKTPNLLTGKALSLLKVSYSITGKDVNLDYLRAFNLASEKESFILTVKDATFLKTTNYLLPLDKGEYILSGKNTLLILYGERLNSLKTNFYITDKSVSLVLRGIRQNNKIINFGNHILTYNGN